MANVSDLVQAETDGACAYCGIKDFRVLTEHHIEQAEPKDQSYDNRIVLCHNCHHLHHEGKGATKDEIKEIKRRLICKTLSRHGVNALKECYRNGRVVASPYTVNHLVELRCLRRVEDFTRVTDDGWEKAVVADAIYELTAEGKRLVEKWRLA